MRTAILICLALMLALPVAMGEGQGMPVDAFIERTHIEADALLRGRIEDLLREKAITARVLDMMDDALLEHYARNLQNDWPIAYFELEDAPSEPMPEGARIRQLAVLQPDGGVTECTLVDFERGLVYYDETTPLIPDVCRAQYAARLSGEDGEALLGLLDGMRFENAIGESAGVERDALRICVAWDGGVTRCAAMGAGTETIAQRARALLDAGRVAAQGDDI